MSELPDLRVGGVEMWPAPPADLHWNVIEADGHYGFKWRRVGPAEVTLLGEVPGARQSYVPSMPFPTLAQARRAGAILAQALKEMDAIRDEPLDPDHEHEWEWHRYSRSDPAQRECVICGVVSDVKYGVAGSGSAA